MPDIDNAATPPAPTVGLPCTYGIGSDSYGMVITFVSPTGHIVKAVHLNKDDDLTSFPPGAEGLEFTRRRNGRYMLKGNATYGYLSLGQANTYRDPSF